MNGPKLCAEAVAHGFSIEGRGAFYFRVNRKRELRRTK